MALVTRKICLQICHLDFSTFVTSKNYQNQQCSTFVCSNGKPQVPNDHTETKNPSTVEDSKGQVMYHAIGEYYLDWIHLVMISVHWWCLFWQISIMKFICSPSWLSWLWTVGLLGDWFYHWNSCHDKLSASLPWTLRKLIFQIRKGNAAIARASCKNRNNETLAGLKGSCRASATSTSQVSHTDRFLPHQRVPCEKTVSHWSMSILINKLFFFNMWINKSTHLLITIYN